MKAGGTGPSWLWSVLLSSQLKEGQLPFSPGLVSDGEKVPSW